MTLPAQTTGRLYVCDLHGNTLVIRPRGDSVGFGVGQLRNESAQVRKYLDEPAVRHLLIDLSAERYFGSMVLGELLEFGNTIKERGGRVGLCQVSDDLLVVLNMMQMNQRWEFFPNTKVALQSVASIPWPQRLWKYRRAAMIVVALGLVTTAILLIPRSDPGKAYAGQVVELWENYRRQRVTATTEEQQWMKMEIQEKLQPMIAELQRRSRHQELSSQERSVLFVSRFWLKALDDQGEVAQASLVEVQHFMRQLYAVLGEPEAAPTTIAADLPVETRPENEPARSE